MVIKIEIWFVTELAIAIVTEIRPSAETGKVPLRTFITEILLKARTSYNTLLVALYYLDNFDHLQQSPPEQPSSLLLCGRKMFLAALILASKYLQDATYNARSWGKITGLEPRVINLTEIEFLKAVSWRIHIQKSDFNKWEEKKNLKPKLGCEKGNSACGER